ncbi:SARP family transcriptional regulator [Longispora fulva]|uniref:DNA-binding SARP family transcriptional activator/tetratricopeptide (TPR) repeat protein n=1 Tax=Longispora fulva TaxID=619741 RepID=A0A8J7GPD0_9ACTN|nr:AfsR/SARP family transcriptional regulator [Longispora fulva]MBG6138620.1 DNA-binding SARP family transcriptional activator/tetratricopeptide (TPR) repeat protein [Longispora fulva]GIG62273.1 SARP family transcriptional regulator [Longispora fulva]
MLGPFELVSPAGTLALGGPRRRATMALLAVRAGTVVSVDQIIDGVWGDTAPPGVRNQIQVYVSALRGLLTGQGESRDLIQTHPGGYLFRPRRDAVDLRLFEDRVTDADGALARGRLTEAGGLLREALALWRGPALGGVTGRFAETEAARLAERRIAVIEQRLDIDLALGRHPALVAELVNLVDEYPLREVLRARLMLALYLGDRTAEALSVYRDARATLVEELGIEPGTRLRELEQAILRGDRPAVLAERWLSDARLSAPAPAPAPAVAGRAAHLPADLAEFVGRHAEISAAVATLSGTGPAPATLVIVGQPGMGKTSLAVHLGHRVRDQFPDGQLYVNLRGPQGDPETVLGSFLRALGRTGPLPDNLAERSALYRSALADQRILVVLDDAASERQVRPLLPGSGTCAVLVTSRANLAGLGTHRLVLEPLGEEYALTLLAGVVGRDRVTAELDAAGEIVHLCGYLPLAVQIAAMRLSTRPHWSLERLARALRDEHRRLDELAVGDLELRASLALSYDGLPAAARVGFRRLGLVGAADVPSWVVAALLDVGPEDADDVLDELVDVHLLEPHPGQPDGSVRYRMHDLPRLYARERAEAEDPAEVRLAAVRRVFDAYLDIAGRANAALASDFVGAPPPSAPRWALPDGLAEELCAAPLDWFETERASIVSAVGQAVELGDAATAGGLAAASATFFEVRNYFDDWQRTHRAALDLCAARGDALTAVPLRRNLGELHTIQDNYDLAVEHFSTALVDARALGLTGQEAACLAGLGYLRRVLGQYAAATEAFTEAARLGRELRNPACEVYATLGLGVICRETGRAAESTAHYEHGRTLSLASAYRPGEAQALRGLGLLALDRDALDEAEEHLAAARDIHVGSGDRLGQAHALLWLAEIRIRRGALPAGETMLAWCLLVYREHDNAFGQALTLRRLGSAHLTGGRVDSARGALTEAVRIWRRLRSPYWLADSLDVLVAVEDRRGDEAAANSARQEARRLRAGLRTEAAVAAGVR